jgi:hypothetical protein
MSYARKGPNMQQRVKHQIERLHARQAQYLDGIRGLVFECAMLESAPGLHDAAIVDIALTRLRSCAWRSMWEHRARCVPTPRARCRPRRSGVCRRYFTNARAGQTRLACGPRCHASHLSRALNGKCVARSTRVEEDGLARRTSSGALVGHCHDRNRNVDLSPCLAALVWT